MAIKTLILRFRDLSTGPGQTLALHEAIIAKKGYVWWGWWNKAGETVPAAAFQELNQAIRKNGPLTILLFDSGGQQLWQAKVGEILWNISFEAIPSPDEDYTPEYYHGKKNPVWFKIMEFGDAPAGEEMLQEYSYERVDELFETKRSIFDRFYGKRVASLAELKTQERTMWFLRPYEVGDATHEIQLYGKSEVDPAHFPRQPILSRSNRLLWVSDPHFSDEHHEFALEQGIHQDTLSQAIHRDLEAEGRTELAGMILSGDLSWSAQPSEFDHARRFIDHLSSWATLTPERVLVCPGNHDIAFSANPAKKGSKVSVGADKAKANYTDFYQKLYNLYPNQHLACGRRFLLGNSRLVEIAMLNSSVLDQQKGLFQGQGYLSQDQLELVEKEMGWRADEEQGLKGYRICVLHHHVVPILDRETPVYGRQASVVYDAGALVRWLVAHRVDLVLHGHMHHFTVLRESRALNLETEEIRWHNFVIAALGSSGVVRSHTVGGTNMYALLEFSADDVRLIVRDIDASPVIRANIPDKAAVSLNPQ